MAEISEATKDKILQSAKKEFLEKGFMTASLRTIAANAGLTTGAMYRHFKDKDALFCALVDEIIEKTMSLVKASGVENHKNLTIQDIEEHSREEKQMMMGFLDYIYEHQDSFYLLFTRAAGSTHEKFLEEISDIYTESAIQTIRMMMEKLKIEKQIDDMFIHLLSNATIDAYAEVVIHKMKKEDAVVFIENVYEFFHFGFYRLFGISC